MLERAYTATAQTALQGSIFDRISSFSAQMTSLDEGYRVQEFHLIEFFRPK
jgi:hypothetical protein